jgi:WD40 repeat protein
MLVMAAGLLLALLPAYAQGPLPVQWLNTPLNSVNSMAYSPNGKLLAVAGETGIQIRDSGSNAVLNCLLTGEPDVYCLAISPDGSLLAAGGSSGVVEVWNLASASLLLKYATSAAGINSLAFSPDGAELADGGYTVDKQGYANGGAVEIRQARTGSLVRAISTSASWSIDAVAFSPDGTILADAGLNSNGDTEVELWSTADGSLTRTLASAGGLCLAFSPDGKTLAAGGYDSYGFVGVWNIASGSRLRTFPTNAQYVSSVAFSPDGSTLADGGGIPDDFSGSSGVLELWSVSTGANLSELATAISGGVNCIAISPDGSTLAAGGQTTIMVSNTYGDAIYPGILEIWNLPSAQLNNTFEPYSPGANAIAYSRDGKLIADGGASYGYYEDPLGYFSSSFSLGQLEVRNASTGAVVSTPIAPADPSTSAVTCIEFSRDGKTLASGGYTYESTTNYNDYTRVFQPHGDSSTYTTTSGFIQFWNTGTGAPSGYLSTMANGGVNSLAYSPDGKTLLDAGITVYPNGPSEGIYELWDVASGKQLRYRIYPMTIHNVAFSPDGRIMVLAGRGYDSNRNLVGVVELRRVATDQLLESLPTAASDGVASIAFSPDGKTLVVGGSQHQQAVMEFWDTASGKLLASPTLPAGTQQVASIAFSPLGDGIVAGIDSTMQTISLANYGLLQSFSMGASSVTAVAVAPDGHTLAFTQSSGQLGVARNPLDTLHLAGFALSRSSVTAGDAVSGTVTLSAPAPAGGITVPVTADSPAVALSSSTVTIPAGKSAASFTVYTASNISSDATVNVTVSFKGQTEAAMLAVRAETLTGLTLSTTGITGGASLTGRVRLSQPAPANGVVVLLSGQGSGIAFPLIVAVMPGATTGTFQITTSPVASATQVRLVASLNGGYQTATLTIQPAATYTLALNPAKVTGGASSTLTVTLSTAAPSGGLTFALASSKPAVATVGTQVTIPAGKKSVTAIVTTATVTSQSSVSLTATLGSVVSKATLTVVP